MFADSFVKLVLQKPSYLETPSAFLFASLPLLHGC